MKSVLKILVFLSLATQADIFQIINDPIEALSVRYAITKKAKKSIYSSKFIFHADDTGLASLALLRKQAREMNDPDIRLLFDGGGPLVGTDVPPEIILHLMNEGIKIKFFNNVYDKKVLWKNAREGRLLKGLENRLHDKLFIIDDEFLLTGGRNIEDTYFSVTKKSTYADRDVLVTGQAVLDSKKHFLKYWNSEITTEASYGIGTRNRCKIRYPKSYYFPTIINGLKRCKEAMIKVGKAMLDQQEKKIDGLIKKYKISKDFSANIQDELDNNSNLKVEFISDGLKGDSYENLLSLRLFEVLMRAEKEVVIESPYLIPSENLLKGFDALLKKGVEITILTNSLSSIDGLQVFAGYAKYRSGLMRLGKKENRLKIHEYYGDQLNSPHGSTIHSKSMSIDGKYALIGSYNLDKLSEFYNSEVAVMAHSQQKALELKEYIEERKKYSYKLGTDGIPCPPGACEESEDCEFTGGVEPHPFSDAKKQKKIQRYIKILNIPKIGPWLEKHL